MEEALENIKEVIEICLEEVKPGELNKFIGIRELEVSQDAWITCNQGQSADQVFRDTGIYCDESQGGLMSD